MWAFYPTDQPFISPSQCCWSLTPWVRPYIMSIRSSAASVTSCYVAAGWILVQWNMCPLKTLACDTVWNRYVLMILDYGGLSAVTCFFVRIRKGCTMEQIPCKDRGRDWNAMSPSWRASQLLIHTRNQRKAMITSLSLAPIKQTLSIPWFWLPELSKLYFCWIKWLNLRNLV